MKTLRLLSCALIAATFGISNLAVAQESAKFTPEQTKQIEQIAHDYIVNNPTVLLEASQKFREQQMQKEQEQIGKVKAEIPMHKNEIFKTGVAGRSVIGNPNGKIIIAEFLSYECPNCRVMGGVVDNLIKSNSEVKVIIIPWPFEAPDDVYAAKAVFAAEKQGKFKELHNALLASQEFLSKDKIDAIVKSIGLDVEKLKKDMDDKTLEAGIKGNFDLAKTVGINGTPSFFVTNAGMTKFELIPGRASEDDLNKAIKQVQ